MAEPPVLRHEGATTAVSPGSMTLLPAASAARPVAAAAEGQASALRYWLSALKVGNGAAMPPVDQTSPVGRNTWVQNPPLCPLRALGSESVAVQVPAGQVATGRRATTA